MDMAPFKLPPNFKFHLFFSRSKSIIPNPYQFNAKVECSSFIVNPPPTILVSFTTLKGKVMSVFENTPIHEQMSTYVLSIFIPNKPKKKANKSKWELNKVYQNKWATRFSWFKVVCEKDGKLMMVKCKICTNIEGREKLIVPKLNSLIKHYGLKKCIKARPRIIIGKLYICPTNVHVQNEKLYASKGWDNVVIQVANGDKVERKKKYL